MEMFVQNQIRKELGREEFTPSGSDGTQSGFDTLWERI